MELEEETNIFLLMKNVMVAGYTRKAKQCVLCWRSSTDPDPVNSECWLNWGYPQDMKIDHEKCIVAVSGKVDGFCNKAHMIFYGDMTVAELKVKLTEEPAKEEFEQHRDAVVSAVMCESTGFTRFSKLTVLKYKEMVMHDPSQLYTPHEDWHLI